MMWGKWCYLFLNLQIVRLCLCLLIFRWWLIGVWVWVVQLWCLYRQQFSLIFIGCVCLRLILLVQIRCGVYDILQFSLIVSFCVGVLQLLFVCVIVCVIEKQLVFFGIWIICVCIWFCILKVVWMFYSGQVLLKCENGNCLVLKCFEILFV